MTREKKREKKREKVKKESTMRKLRREYANCSLFKSHLMPLAVGFSARVTICVLARNHSNQCDVHFMFVPVFCTIEIEGTF